MVVELAQTDRKTYDKIVERIAPELSPEHVNDELIASMAHPYLPTVDDDDDYDPWDDDDDDDDYDGDDRNRLYESVIQTRLMYHGRGYTL